MYDGPMVSLWVDSVVRFGYHGYGYTGGGTEIWHASCAAVQCKTQSRVSKVRKLYF